MGVSEKAVKQVRSEIIMVVWRGSGGGMEWVVVGRMEIGGNRYKWKSSEPSKKLNNIVVWNEMRSESKGGEERGVVGRVEVSGYRSESERQWKK